MLWIVISVSLILIACNILYETDDNQYKLDKTIYKTNELEPKSNKLHKM